MKKAVPQALPVPPLPMKPKAPQPKYKTLSIKIYKPDGTIEEFVTGKDGLDSINTTHQPGKMAITLVFNKGKDLKSFAEMPFELVLEKDDSPIVLPDENIVIAK